MNKKQITEINDALKEHHDMNQDEAIEHAKSLVRPPWHSLDKATDRIAELEHRIAELESKPALVWATELRERIAELEAEVKAREKDCEVYALARMTESRNLAAAFQRIADLEAQLNRIY